MITIAEVPAGIPEYNRSEWRHWTDEDGDCQDSRQEVLIAESLVEVTYEDDRQCRVEAGKWWAPHLGHHLEVWPESLLAGYRATSGRRVPDLCGKVI